MMEDDEVVLKNSRLYKCLIEAGFQDFESAEIFKSEPKFEEQKSVQNLGTSDLIEIDFENWHEYNTYVQSFLHSRLVFEDDAILIENSMIIFYSSPSLITVSNALNIASYPVAIGLVHRACRFFNVEIHPVIFISLHAVPFALFCFRQSISQFRKYKRKMTIKDLLICLKEFSLFVQKSIQYIVKNSTLVSPLNHCFADHENNHYLRETAFSTLRSMIMELKKLTIWLVKYYPLKEPLRSQQYHLAFLTDENLHCIRPDGSITVEILQKMKYTYFLLQSELLRQISLCLIPGLRTSSSHTSVLRLFDKLTDLNSACLQQCGRLKSAFEMHYLFEQPKLKTRKELKNINWTHREAYIKVCSFSQNLQAVLRETRRLEQFLENVALEDVRHDEIVHFLDVGLKNVEFLYEMSHCALDDFRKYVFSLHPKHDHPALIDLRTKSETQDMNILVGMTDFSPPRADEVFIGVSETDVKMMEINDVKDNFNNPYAAKLLINELKIALRDKADEWKQREKIALKSKNIEDTCETEGGFVTNELQFRANISLQKSYEETVLDGQRINDLDKFLPSDSTAELRQHFFSESSFAKQIAAVSASWKMAEEQHFSLESNDTEIGDV